MSLTEILKPVRGKRREYLLYRIAEIGVKTACDLSGISEKTMNTWHKDLQFNEINRQLPELTADYKKDAMTMLRRNTQMSAILLEADIIAKISEEIKTGQYDIIRTPLAKAVYNKLISDLDTPDITKTLNWEQKIAQFIVAEDTLDGEYSEIHNLPSPKEQT